MDMNTDIFADTAYGKAAIKKLGHVNENFRLYEAGWLGENPKEWDVMKVVGCEFRVAKSGKNKGKLIIPVDGTKRTVYVTKKEMDEFR